MFGQKDVQVVLNWHVLHPTMQLDATYVIKMRILLETIASAGSIQR